MMTRRESAAEADWPDTLHGWFQLVDSDGTGHLNKSEFRKVKCSNSIIKIMEESNEFVVLVFLSGTSPLLFVFSCPQLHDMAVPGDEQDSHVEAGVQAAVRHDRLGLLRHHFHLRDIRHRLSTLAGAYVCESV